MQSLLPKLKFAVSSKNNSSYKYVVALAIICLFDGNKRYSFDDLLRFVIPFYFNMSVRYKIIERASGKIPKVIQNIIDYSTQNHLEYLCEKDFQFLSKQNLKTFFACPITCFEPINKLSKINGENSFFTYSLKDKFIELKAEFYALLNDMNLRDIAKDVVLIVLVRFLEKYNNSPNILRKISGDIPKRDLSRYKKAFTDKNSPLYYPYCAICGQPIITKGKEDFSLDHFIPFNFMFADDIWNLIPAHRACNSFKNDKIGSDEVFDYLVNRNKKLYELPKDNPYFSFLQKELFDIYPTFESLYQDMIEMYVSCKSMGYMDMNDSLYNQCKIK